MKHHFNVILILLLPLLAVVGYATLEHPVTTEFTQIDLSCVDSLLHPSNDSTAIADSTLTDSVGVDSTQQRILFVGDSMVGGLGPFMAKYAYANGHELTYVTWPSSTTFAWSSDTLRNFIRKADPTFIMISIGGNEQPARNLKQCEENIRKILATVGNIPYIWICTPAWNKEAPFNDIPARLCGPKRFYDSRRLELERGADHHHPSYKGYSKWMDSVAVWMADPELTAHPILMEPYPKDAPNNKCTTIVLKPNGKLNFAHVADTPKGDGKKGGDAKPAKSAKDAPAKDAPKSKDAPKGKKEPAKEDGAHPAAATSTPQSAPTPQPTPQPVAPPPANHEGE